MDGAFEAQLDDDDLMPPPSDEEDKKPVKKVKKPPVKKFVPPPKPAAPKPKTLSFAEQIALVRNKMSQKIFEKFEDQ